MYAMLHIIYYMIYNNISGRHITVSVHWTRLCHDVPANVYIYADKKNGKKNHNLSSPPDGNTRITRENITFQMSFDMSVVLYLFFFFILSFFTSIFLRFLHYYFVSIILYIVGTHIIQGEATDRRRFIIIILF